MLSLPELVLKVKADASSAITSLKGVEYSANSVGKSMAQVAKENGVSVGKVRSDVMKLAHTYRQQGMSMSDAMKQAYKDMGISASEATDKMQSGFGKLTTFIKGAAIGAVTALGVAILKTGKDALKAYSDFEQLSGGVEKIFGPETAKTVEANAKRAFETAGMSANQYMETVTGFSATLLKDLGGDTEKAAQYADMAIQDMSDNANTFGTDIQSIQNAYQGFAKGNATMLDNLKVGYGGTKTELLQLAKDMGVVDESIKSFDDMSFPDAIDAIHKVQEELNITGTTAKEAAHTIEGSINSMKASWTNFLTALGTGDDKEVEEALDNFMKSLGNASKNVGAAMGRIAKSMTKLLYNKIKDAIKSGKASDLGNALVTKISDALSALGDKLPTLIPKLFEWATKTIQGFLGKVQDFIDGKSKGGDFYNKIIQAARNLLSGLATGLIKAIPIVLKALPKILLAILKVMLTWPIKLIKMGWQLLKALVGGLIDGVKNAFPNFIKAIAQAWENVKAKIKEKIEAIKAVWNAVKFAAKSAKVWLEDKVTAAKNKLKKAWDEFRADPKKFVMEALDKASKIIKKVKDLWDEFLGRPSIKTVEMNEIHRTSNLIENIAKSSAHNVKRHRAGIDFIPRDEYPALLHYGEAVLSRSEANAWRKQQAMAGRAAASRAADQPIIVNTDLYVDGRKIASTTAPYMKKAIDRIDTADNRQLGLV